MFNVAILSSKTNSGLTISGNVYNDQNGNTDGVDNPVLAGKDNIPEGLNILVIDEVGLVAQIVPVASVGNYGTFTINVLPNSNYNLRITNQSVSINDNDPGTVLPAYWENTGQNNEHDSGSGDDGTNDGLVSVSIEEVSKAPVNFGIRITPNPLQPSYIKKISQSTSPSTFINNATDVENINGTIDRATIESAFGVGSAGLVPVALYHSRLGSYVNEVILADKTSSTTFWSSIENWILANDFYNFTTINVFGEDYQKIEDYTHRSYIAMMFNEIRGNIYHDPNDLTDSLINDSRSLVTPNSFNQLNIPSGLRVAVVDRTTNLVVKTGTVNANSYFRITNIPYGNYDLYLTNSVPVVGNPPPALTLPSTNNWIYTGDGFGGISDGTVDGKIENITLAGNITNVTFGIKATS